MKKNSFFIYLISSIMIGVLIYFVIFGGFTAKKDDVKEQEIINEIEEYGYVLHDTEPQIYIDLFTELETELAKEELDEEVYANLISKLFIIDFYNLDSKTTKNDVGGVQYIATSFKDDFTSLAKTTIYKHLESNLYGERTTDLPIVIEIEIDSTEITSYSYGEEIDEAAYEITLTWGYKKDLGYETSATVIIIHEEDKLVIAEMD